MHRQTKGNNAARKEGNELLKEPRTSACGVARWRWFHSNCRRSQKGDTESLSVLNHFVEDYLWLQWNSTCELWGPCNLVNPIVDRQLGTLFTMVWHLLVDPSSLLSVTTEWTGGSGFWVAPSHNTSWSTAVFAGRPHERKQHGLPFFNHSKTTTWVVKCGRLNRNKPESFVNKWDKWWLFSWLQYNMSTCEIVHLRCSSCRCNQLPEV